MQVTAERNLKKKLIYLRVHGNRLLCIVVGVISPETAMRIFNLISLICLQIDTDSKSLLFVTSVILTGESSSVFSVASTLTFVSLKEVVIILPSLEESAFE